MGNYRQISNLIGPSVGNKYTYSCKSMKEKALAAYNSKQIPNNNNIQRMLIIIISLRWKHFVIISYLYQIPTMSFTT